MTSTEIVQNSSILQITANGNDTNMSSVICPKWEMEDFKLIEAFEYWVGGVSVCVLAIPGMLFNIIAIYYLITRTSIHTTFNSLLISLFAMDSIYLLFETLETFRRRFRLESRLHLILLPKFTYPLMFVSLSASIFMTVGVAHERYDAIMKPIQHRQSMRSGKYRRKKFLVYLLTVCFLAVGFNVPKFFEVELEWQNSMRTLKNGTELR